MPSAGKIRVGTCSWAERTIIASHDFYPHGVTSAEERLRFYASRFDTVEVDATYYAIPALRTTAQWAERTPAGFSFNVKANGALTGHAIDPRTLPKALRELLTAADREKRTVYLKEPAILRAVAAAFVASLEPLRAAGKLGLLVFQFPPWFRYRPASLDYILFCRELMGELPMAVEFRNGSWLSDRHREAVFAFLTENRITYVTADEPQVGTEACVPFLPEATTGVAYVRLHGRNRATWEQKGLDTASRFDYLYGGEELQGLAAAARELSHKARTVFVLFNNCHLGYAIMNALEMAGLVRGG